MRKLSLIFLLVLLILVLGLINAAWIFSYKKVISSNVFGGKNSYTISHEFDDTLSLDTTNNADSAVTSMKIENLNKDVNVKFEISTSKKSLDSNCSSVYTYTNDCSVIATYNNTLTKTEEILSDGENLTLIKSPTVNFINYRIECVENSCPQRVNSTITLTEI